MTSWFRQFSGGIFDRAGLWGLYFQAAGLVELFKTFSIICRRESA
jgi:hypothetical protein